MRRVDLAGADLDAVLPGTDVIVHLAGIVDPIPDDALMARVNVDGTRRLLDAAARTGVRRIVRISPAMVYGAWPTNPIPITEAAPLAPNPGYAPAVQAAEVERLVAEWRHDHPGVVVTTLRAAPVLGAGADHLWPGSWRAARSRCTTPLRPSSASTSTTSPGRCSPSPSTTSPASSTWPPTAGCRWRTRGPSGARTGPACRRVWRSGRCTAPGWTGLGEVPPSVVPYLVHPWVVANDRMRATGWTPAHGNEDTLLETVDALPPLRPPAWVVPVAASAAVVAVAGAWVAARALRRRRRARAGGRARRLRAPALTRRR